MKIISAIVCAIATSGCGTAAYATMSTHTIGVGPERTADVVWVLQSNEGLLRCSDSAAGPVCVKAKVGTLSAAPPAAAAPTPEPAAAATPSPTPEPAFDAAAPTPAE